VHNLAKNVNPGSIVINDGAIAGDTFKRDDDRAAIAIMVD